jgi:hypothetical protein
MQHIDFPAFANEEDIGVTFSVTGATQEMIETDSIHDQLANQSVGTFRTIATQKTRI